jgi:hypothetical protein
LQSRSFGFHRLGGDLGFSENFGSNSNAQTLEPSIDRRFAGNEQLPNVTICHVARLLSKEDKCHASEHKEVLALLPQ